jgi:hypothetical protein
VRRRGVHIFALIGRGSTLVLLHDYMGLMIGLAGTSNILQTQWVYGLFGVPIQSGA